MKKFEKLVVFFGIALFSFILSIHFVNAQNKQDAGNLALKTVKIGTQEWMASNLNVSNFRNGDIIVEAKTAAEWEKAGLEKRPAWRYYADSLKNGEIYGKLYNWYAVNDPRGIAPAGCHVPSNANWTTLVKFVGNIDIAGKRLKDKVGWKSNGKGDNQSGFAAKPGGLCDAKGKFTGLGNKGQWWSTSAEIGGGPLVYSLMLTSFSVEASFIKLEKENGLSVRCIKD